jgi:hypothetical protein
MASYAVAVKRGVLSREEAVRMVNESLDVAEQTTPARNRGWLYHFVKRDGSPMLDIG